MELIILAILAILVIGLVFFRGVILGALLGGIVGCFLRPSIPMVGQLPFETVITRGSNLRGLNVVLRSTAEQSFGSMMVGATIGAIVLGVLGFMTRKPSSAVATVLTTGVSPTPSTVTASGSPVSKFCTKCGVALRNEVAFCGACGTKRE